MPDPMPSPKPNKPRKIKPPRGTRDLYPAEAARRRWLMERWREVSVRHGFEEVDGPTYEDADLYAVKSGEGILGELFQAFSGKSPEEVEQVRELGRAPYALRPEFTPSLARMYAAKAAGLPKPCKWFMAGPFFRAERPQRGRLREFLQWNCDVLGLDIPPEKWYAEDAESRAEVAEAKARMDAECIACLVSFLEHVGLTPDECSVRFSHRGAMIEWLVSNGLRPERAVDALMLLDNWNKGDREQITSELSSLGFQAAKQLGLVMKGVRRYGDGEDTVFAVPKAVSHVWRPLAEMGLTDWVAFDLSIVRGLAYYTGTVFEVIADGERAVAGGGRYDNLIELFGGPPTPAVGFAMGDVVLGLLLQDKGLMPSDDELLGLAGQHPDVFVISTGTEEAETKVRPVVAQLRRGERPLHARHSYKATKKEGKLLDEAKKQGARLAVIIQDSTSCIVKDLRTGEQWPEPVAIDDLHAKLVAAP